MSAWHTSSSHEKADLVREAVAQGYETSREIAEFLGVKSRGSISALCMRRGLQLPNTQTRASGTKSRQPFVFRSPDPNKPLHRPHTTPEGLPKPGEGMAMSEALENDGCRFIIGEWERGEEPEMCGKPLRPIDKTKHRHFCMSCQEHLFVRTKSEGADDG